MPNRSAPIFDPRARRYAALCFALAVFSVIGCGINPELTSEQQDRDLNARMAWVDKAIQVAERHNLAYRVEVESTGKPSIGETIDLYMNTGVSAKVMMFGNAAAAPPNDMMPPVTSGSNTTTVPVQTSEDSPPTTRTDGANE